MTELTNTQALCCYGTGLVTAILGIYNQAVLIGGFVVLGGISVFMTFFGE